jgi:hypothetical protein
VSTRALIAISFVLAAGCAQEATLGAPMPEDSRPNYMFVTSGKRPPRYQPLTVADDTCNQAAQAAGLPGRYRAWISSASADARDRLAGARGWVRTDGAPFADTVADLAEGRIRMPPSRDEFGQEIILDTIEANAVATGTNEYGVVSPGHTCHEWAYDEMSTVMVGFTYGTTKFWASGNDLMACGEPMRLYCFGVDQNFPLAIEAAVGKRAFVSEKAFRTDGGLAAADAVCAADAVRAGLTGTFLALLATSEASAASRFADEPSDTTWVRVDGVPLVPPGMDLFAVDGLTSSLWTPLNLTSGGEFLGDVSVTVGADGPRLLAGVDGNCSDWTTTVAEAGVGEARAGAANRVDTWFWYTSETCADLQRVYCLER